MRMNRQRREIIKLDDGWQRIKEGGLQAFLDRVEACNDAELSARPNPVDEMTEIIDIVFQMCIQREPNNFSGAVYDRVQFTTQTYFEGSFIPSLRTARERSEQAFLDEFAKRWKQCHFTVGGMKRMFNYLNRYHVPNSDGLLELAENGYRLFKECVFDKYNEALRNTLLHFIESERNGNIVKRELIKDCVYIFVGLGQELKTNYKGNELGIYQNDFQSHFIRETKKYYEQTAEKWLATKSTPEYLIEVEKVQEAEMDRLVSYLHPGTSEQPLMHCLRETLLRRHQETLLDQDSGLIRMLDEQASSDLERLYRLYKDVKEGVTPIANTFKMYICSLGYKYIDAAKQAEKENSKDAAGKMDLIAKIIALHERFHGHVTKDFDNNQEMSRALKDAFEEFINKTNYVVRYLAKYAHSFMVRGGPAEGLSDNEKEEQMQHIRMIYGYIRDKDVFEREYQLYLSHRLLNSTSASDAMEQKMIGLLKAECGYHWAQKLEDMFKDMQTSKEVMKEFMRQNRKHFDFDVTVNICEYGKWPESVDQKKLNAINPPGELQNLFERLKNFYENKHAGRKFFVRWDKGSGEAAVTFNRKSKVEKILLFKSTYQIMCMLMFNSKNSSGKPIWRFSEIHQQLGIPEEELKTALLPFIHPKLQVLQKKPGGKKIEANHMFRLNGKFTNNAKRIPIPVFKVQKKAAEPKVPAEIAQQRRHQMDAAIVRIMKARRTFTVVELLGEVIQQLQARFQPDPKQIKKRIEVLISQDYLERDEDDRNTLIYKQ